MYLGKSAISQFHFRANTINVYSLELTLYTYDMYLTRKCCESVNRLQYLFICATLTLVVVYILGFQVLIDIP